MKVDIELIFSQGQIGQFYTVYYSSKTKIIEQLNLKNQTRMHTEMCRLS